MEAAAVQLDKEGKVQLPDMITQSLKLKPETSLVAYTEAGRIVIEPREHLWQLIHQQCQNIPDDCDLSQELIEERRQSIS
jgi:bifunctional DNA-binding transcriptional regulator/antitoxin component of YhaV-PrlF toxin-antitoxin module